jgi:hypothetical protein
MKHPQSLCIRSGWPADIVAVSQASGRLAAADAFYEMKPDRRTENQVWGIANGAARTELIAV